ncbi:glycosyltransferase [Arthrobacter sp. ES3-54]|uniref:glycosyltransferase n=1 Tax=Arthrobacter sp. ES3-54 TaxID=1502991 RepID=UPI00240722FF|nr:glycosyltransferase [Arthrobacter sp. ES3-54]MDF9751950.1 glycosyltransferase involved in cell wall biosynthesis/O-antigen/teichoic acid export membrane protein [Arthrobacter sp. ES3-54]
MSDLRVSVVVPARNAAAWLGECLESIRSQHPHEMIVVDGCSTDDTAAIARDCGATVISDEGRGLPAARMLGARSATGEVVALIDADVVLPSKSLPRLLTEFESGGYDGLQFGLASEADGPGYWGAALAWHHNHSRVRKWFGVSATLMRRDVLLDVGFDDDFRSGEDVELRIRLEQAGYRLGVSDSVVVRHRFDDTFDYARDQWLQDGAGMARTVRKHTGRAGWLVMLPLLATVRGVGLSLVRAPRFLPYWMGFLLYNYRAMAGELLRPAHKPISVGGNAAWLAAARIAPMVTGFLFWALAALVLPPEQLGLGSAVVSAALLTVQLGMLGVGPATLTLLPAENDGGRRLIAASLLAVATFALLGAGLLVIITNWLGTGVGEAWIPLVTVLFLATSLLAASAYQLDYVGVAQERADRTLVRSLVQSLVQLAFLAAAFAVGLRDLAVIVAAVAAGALASVLVGLRQLARAQVSPDWKHGLRPRPALKLLKPGLPNHALMLADRAPGYLLPLIVAATLGPAPTAAWFVVWMMASAVFFVPQSAGFTLQTALAGKRARPGLLGSALRASFLLTLVAGLILMLAGPLLLGLLGSQYASAWVLLPVLVPALLLSCVTQVYYGLCRAHGRLFESTAVATLAAILIVAPAAAVAQQYGLTGVSVLWAVAQATASLIAAWRLITLTRMNPAPAAGEIPSARHQPS